MTVIKTFVMRAILSLSHADVFAQARAEALATRARNFREGSAVGFCERQKGGVVFRKVPTPLPIGFR